MKKMVEYFNNEADMIAFVLLFLDGEERNKFLHITRGLYGNKAAAKKWAERLMKKVGDNDAAITEIKKLYKGMTEEDYDAPETTETMETTETIESPKTFKVGNEAVSAGGWKEKVVKVTKCFVWITYCEDESDIFKLKIRKDENGNEYCTRTFGGRTIGAGSYNYYAA